MELRNVWFLRGPNHWTRSPALEVEVVLPTPPAAPPDGPAFGDRLGALMAALGGDPPAGEASEGTTTPLITT